MVASIQKYSFLLLCPKLGGGGSHVHLVKDNQRVIVTPAVYPRLVEFLHFDIQSTGQKSHCVNTPWGHRNALF